MGTGIAAGTGNLNANTLVGNSIANTLSGAAGADSIAGGDGADSLSGGDGADTFLGEGGNDTLSGGNDIDSLVGGAGNDSLAGDAANDIIVGDAGADTLDANLMLGLPADGRDYAIAAEMLESLPVENPIAKIETPRLAVIRQTPTPADAQDGISARAKVPSWDEIMFGHKTEEKPEEN